MIVGILIGAVVWFSLVALAIYHELTKVVRLLQPIAADDTDRPMPGFSHLLAARKPGAIHFPEGLYEERLRQLAPDKEPS